MSIDRNRLFTFDELDALPERETEYYVDNLLPKGGVSILVGDSGIGKSHFILSMLLAMQTQSLAFGKFNTVQTGVLYFSEDDQYIIKEYKKRIAVNFPEKSQQDILLYVRPKSINDVITLVDEYYPGLVIIDPLSVINPVKNDNSNQEVRNFIERLKEISYEKGPSILFTRHMSKPDPKATYGTFANRSRTLGAQEFMAAPDQRIILSRDATGKFIIEVSGKHLADWKANLLIDTSNGILTIEGGPDSKVEESKRVSKYREPLISFFKEYTEAHVKASAIAKILKTRGYVEFTINTDALRHELRNMVTDNILQKDEEGAYHYIKGIRELIEYAHTINPRFATPLSVGEVDTTEEDQS